MRIDFLYWEQCPSHEEALARLRAVLAEEGVPAEVSVRHIGTEEEAEATRFPGSPTIRIDGQDIQPEGAVRGAGRLTCRLYLLEDRRPSPLPSIDMIRRALRRARTDTVKGVSR